MFLFGLTLKVERILGKDFSGFTSQIDLGLFAVYAHYLNMGYRIDTGIRAYYSDIEL